MSPYCFSRIFSLLQQLQYVMISDVEDYPRTLTEFKARFSTGQACRDYLLKLRWPEGFVCSRCGSRSAWTTPVTCPV
jgi:hypothetical protein